MINVGIIGYGMAAQTFHFPLLNANPKFRITAVVSRQQNLDLSHYPHCKRYRDTEEMLTHADIDVVVNTAPNNVHFDLTKLCLSAKKHVVLEKPMTVTMQEAQTLVSIAQKNELLLAVFHNRRLDADFLTVKKLIAEERLGQVRIFRSHWDRFRPEVRDRWRENAGPGSGIWYDLGPHLIDQALCLFGLPQAVSANIRSIRPGSKSDDYAHVLLHYPELEVVLNTSPYNCSPVARFTIEGDKANYIKYGLDPQESQLKEGISPNDEAFGIESTKWSGKICYPDGSQEKITSERGQFNEFYSNVAAAINGEAPLNVTPQQALEVMTVLLIAQQSAKKGQRLEYPCSVLSTNE